MEEPKKLIIPNSTEIKPATNLNTGPHISARSFKPGWSNLARKRKKTAVEYHLGDMPEDVWYAGIAAAEAGGHPNPHKYWTEDNNKRFKAWIRKHPHWGPQ